MKIRNLLYTAVFIPYTVAFLENAPAWVDNLDISFNLIWAIDLVLNFFFAYEDNNEELVYNKKVRKTN